jgi:hypothetical protein
MLQNKLCDFDEHLKNGGGDDGVVTLESRLFNGVSCCVDIAEGRDMFRA